jgi:RND family efflux transporter MFP subunit
MGCARDAPPPPPRLIDGDLAAADSPAPLPEFIGVLVLGYTVEVAPKFEGKVEEVFVHPGDHVKQGTPLAHVDLKKTRDDLEIARADLQGLEAEEQDANQKLRRRIPLSGGAVSREEVSSARAVAHAAHAKVLSQRTRIEQLTLALHEAELRAPFAGVVATRYVDPGAVVGPGKPVARLLESGGEPEVRFAVPEEYSRELAVGRGIHVSAPSLPVAIEGQIVSVAPEVASGSRFVFAAARLHLPPTLQPRVSSGVVAHVTLAAKTTPERTAVEEQPALEVDATVLR